MLRNIAAMVDGSIAKLEQVKKMALDNGCPGGAHGIAIPHGGDMASLSSEVITNLTNAKAAINETIP